MVYDKIDDAVKVHYYSNISLWFSLSEIWISMPADVVLYDSMAFLMQFLLVLGGY